MPTASCQLIIRKWPLALACLVWLVVSSQAAKRVDDVVVNPQPMYFGKTFHGYAETRIALENRSAKPHHVTITYPNRSWNYGECVEKISRSIVLPPGARSVVPFRLPPLSSNGDGNLRVMVDDTEDWVDLPNGNNHMPVSSGVSGGYTPAVLLVSRGLDHDQMMKAFAVQREAYTAAMATGPPDARATPGHVLAVWKPDHRFYGRTNWLELEYSPPINADKIRIYQVDASKALARVVLRDTSGTNELTVKAAHPAARTSRTSVVELSFPPLPGPIQSVRLEYEAAPPHTISVDAVELSGPGGSTWAKTARASSDNSAMASSSMPAGSRAEIISCLRAELPIADWSEHWLAYTPFDLIALTAEEFQGLPAAVATAVWRYVEAGGELIIFGDTAVPAPWKSAARKFNSDLTECSVGFGRCLVSTQPNINELREETLEHLRQNAREAALFWQTMAPDDEAANRIFPVIENVKIPVRGMVLIMLGFVIVIGPVNLIWLSRRNRRTWMLWTIPAISFGTTLLVFVYSLLREGVTPDTRVRSLTLIHQASRAAVTVGAAGFYCPLTPNRGLSFEYDTEITPLVRAAYRASGTRRELDWTQTQHLRRGWISARVPAHFRVRKAETRRERLQLEKSGDRLEVINGLGGLIDSLWLADARGNIFQARSIAAGQKATLTPTGRAIQGQEKAGPRQLLRDASFAVKLPADTEKFLQPGTYLANLEGNPFVEPGLGSADRPERNRASAVVFGVLETVAE